MNLFVLDLFDSIVGDNTITVERMSSYISQNIRALIRAFKADGRSLSDLFCRLTVEDYVGRRPVIRGMAPEFKELDYVKAARITNLCKMYKI